MVKVKAAETGKDMQDFAEEALRAYLSGTPSPVVNKESTTESSPTGVTSEFAEIRKQLGLILGKLSEYGEARSRQNWEDFDRRMGEFKAATESLRQLSAKPGGHGKAVRERPAGTVRASRKGSAA